MKAYRMELYEASTEELPQGRLIGSVVLMEEFAAGTPINVLRSIGRAMMHPQPLKGTIAVEEVEQ
jgi:hypothetical protein